MKYFLVLSIVCALMFAGCAPKVVQPTYKTTPDQGTAVTKDDSGKDRSGGVTAEELARAERDRLRMLEEQMRSSLSQQDIYFEFDSYAVQGSELPKLQAVGNWLKQSRTTKIAVEGHCDERGTVEYNFALGQKRAEAVKDHLVKMGIEGARIKTISYGKETPATTGHSEDAWAKNRRAHFTIDQKG
jgi:peptidoglycan-associated lipoprotein